MARRTIYIPLICLLLCVGVFWNLPFAHGKTFNDSTEIRHKQVVFYLVALQTGENFTVNCTTYFNSSIKAYILTHRPTEDAVNLTYVNASDTDDNQNFTTLHITSNTTMIFYIEIIQEDDKTDFLLVNATVSPDRDDFALTRYYIPFISGYPILEFVFTVMAGIFVMNVIIKRRNQSKK